MAHVHKWKFKQKKNGMLRYCRCGERVLEISKREGSFLSDYPEYKGEPKKGTKRKRL